MNQRNKSNKQRKRNEQNKRNEQKKRNAIGVMAGLIGMVRPLLGIMLVAVIMGCIGNLMATFITVLGAFGIGRLGGFFSEVKISVIFVLMIVCALLRGVLRYAEQASNHYIAFKLLARIRHMVFASLRRLAPAKLEGSEKGNLISIITSDIELLEVFYAHTISPIAIAVITSLFMSAFVGHFDWRLGVYAVICYGIVGALIPMMNSHFGQKYGRKYREHYGRLNTTVLDNLYGLDEILQFQQQESRTEKMNVRTRKLEGINRILKRQEAAQKIINDTVILAAGVVMLFLAGTMAARGQISPAEALVCTVSLMSSFGPVAALSALSNNLNQTLASGNRVLNLLEEEPVAEDIKSDVKVPNGDMLAENITFSYDNSERGKAELILDGFTASFQENRITGILGKSGCGKSTLLKLFMRFFETNSGAVCYGNTNVNEIDTASLRKSISYVTQETFLFSDTIENNIRIAKEDASREEVIEAAKKASIHDFIASLPKGYDTMLKELGESVSGGEKQRIGIARAFLHDAKIILLDEPTSNIDSLNEGMILRSLDHEKEGKTIILVSHRKSTMGIADNIVLF